MAKPTRRDLLEVIEECQTLFGKISGAFSDRNPNRAADIYRLTEQGLQLCIIARSADTP